MTTLLLADADILVRAPLAGYLRECGFRVLEAATNEEARAFLADSSSAVDILFADAGLTDGGGFALASWARKEFPDVAVILAGNVEAATKKAGDLCDDEPSVTKPYDHQLVLDRIRRAAAARERDRTKLRSGKNLPTSEEH